MRVKVIEKEKQKTYKFLQDLNSTLEEISLYLSRENKVYIQLHKILKTTFSLDTIKKRSEEIQDILKKEFLENPVIDDKYFKRLRNFIFSNLSLFIDIFNSFFNKLLTRYKSNFFEKDKWEAENPVTLLSASYFLLNLTFKSLRNIVNRYFNIGFKEHIELQVKDDNDPIWDTSNMKYIEFSSDIKRIKEYANIILSQCEAEEIKNNILLHLQISEFIKNAIRHGNKFDIKKKVKIWYDITSDYAKLIIEDEGEGFKNLEEWNRFNKLRTKFIKTKDLKNILKYAAYKSLDSRDDDGGNFLFSALEYWDSGVIFNKKRNRVVVIKYFY